MLDLCCCTQLVSHAPGVIPGLGQPLPFHPRPLDPEFIQTLTWRRPGLDTAWVWYRSQIAWVTRSDTPTHTHMVPIPVYPCRSAIPMTNPNHVKSCFSILTRLCLHHIHSLFPINVIAQNIYGKLAGMPNINRKLYICQLWWWGSLIPRCCSVVSC